MVSKDIKYVEQPPSYEWLKSPCWICTSHTSFRFVAHKLFKEKEGQKPEGLYLLHKCDNEKCINPDHLEYGTQSKNMKDAFVRGRITSEQITAIHPSTLSKEHKKNISKSLTGFKRGPMSQQHKDKLSDSLKETLNRK